MSKNMKLLVSIFLVIAMMGTCAACNSGGGKTPETKTEEPEEVTTEAPEATTEIEVELPKIDPQTYSWSDDEKVVYEDEKATVRCFKATTNEGAEGLGFEAYSKETEDLITSGTYSTTVTEINEIFKLSYECKAVAETFSGKDEVIDYIKEPVQPGYEWLVEYEIPKGMKITYTNAEESFCFYDDGGTVKFGMLDADQNFIYTYPVSDRVKTDLKIVVWMCESMYAYE